jgi:uncharacterized membrane protein
MKKPHARLLRVFVTGLLAALPLAATIGVFWWAVSFIVSWLGPNSAIGRVFIAIGFGVSGSEIVGYLVGIGILLLLIFGLGVLVTTGLQRGMASLLQSVLQRIPLVGSVYDLARRLVGLFAQSKDGGMNSMNAVWCHFGGPPDARDSDGHVQQGVVVLALLSTPEPVLIEGRPYLGLIIPTAPVPVGGGLLFVPKHWVRPAGMGIEAVTSIYVSMGITASEQLRPTPARA